MTNQLEKSMTDLSRGYVPAVIVAAMIASALVAGQWVKGNEVNVMNLDKKVSDLQAQVVNLNTSVSQLTITLAKGPVLPENVVYKADLYKFCLENRALKCPTF